MAGDDEVPPRSLVQLQLQHIQGARINGVRTVRDTFVGLRTRRDSTQQRAIARQKAGHVSGEGGGRGKRATPFKAPQTPQSPTDDAVASPGSGGTPVLSGGVPAS